MKHQVLTGLRMRHCQTRNEIGALCAEAMKPTLIKPYIPEMFLHSRGGHNWNPYIFGKFKPRHVLLSGFFLTFQPSLAFSVYSKAIEILRFLTKKFCWNPKHFLDFWASGLLPFNEKTKQNKTTTCHCCISFLRLNLKSLTRYNC